MYSDVGLTTVDTAQADLAAATRSIATETSGCTTLYVKGINSNEDFATVTFKVCVCGNEVLSATSGAHVVTQIYDAANPTYSVTTATVDSWFSTTFGSDTSS